MTRQGTARADRLRTEVARQKARGLFNHFYTGTRLLAKKSSHVKNYADLRSAASAGIRTCLTHADEAASELLHEMRQGPEEAAGGAGSLQPQLSPHTTRSCDTAAVVAGSCSAVLG